MKQEFELSAKILDDIVEGGVPFGEALRKVFQPSADLRPLRGSVAGLVGCELRHHLMFEYLFSADEYTDFTKEEKVICSLALANAYFYKRFDAAEVSAYLAELLGEEKKAKVDALLERAGSPEKYLADVQPRSDLHLSLRFNTPEWVLKVFRHYGHGTAYKILKANARPAKAYVRVATSSISTAGVVASGDDFEETSVPDVLLYKGKLPLRKVDLYHKGMVYDIRPGTKYVSDKFQVEDPKECFAFVAGRDHSLLRELVESYGDELTMNFGTYDTKTVLDVKKAIDARKLKNVNLFNCDPSKDETIKAAVSRKQDLVFVVPESSHFDAIREAPDFLLHFSTEQLDDIYRRQGEALKGCAEYVEEGGVLVYMIYTISRKEGHNTVSTFLADHPEFHLIEENQLFPFDELDTSIYYCALKKDTQLAKAEEPLPDLNIIESQAPVASSVAMDNQ